MAQTPRESFWHLEADALVKDLKTDAHRGLVHVDARHRLRIQGPNEIQQERPTPASLIFLRQFTSPLVMLLIGASLISFALGEQTETVIILLMVLLGGSLAFVQEYRSERALRQLRKKLSRKATVVRDGTTHRIDARDLVPGDLVVLNIGTVVPADLRLTDIEDLEIDESALTGESEPVPKDMASIPATQLLPQEQTNIAFMGTHVVQGGGHGIVIRTGMQTEMGQTASLLAVKAEETDFQRGLRRFGTFLLKITIGLALIIAVILGLLRGQWLESALFALALAVGISPELLPLIVTINLSRGAIAMSRKKVLVKRLIAIEDLGNADVFCTDKTGTLTVGKLRVRDSVDVDGRPNTLPLSYATHCIEQTPDGQATNPVDQAIGDAADEGHHVSPLADTVQREIISFDFKRRRMSCVVGPQHGDARTLIVKGAAAEVVAQCTHRAAGKDHRPFSDAERREAVARADAFGDQGYRVIAVARRAIGIQSAYSPADEAGLELLGFVLVSDAPKQTAKDALIELQTLNTRIVILTGDTERVTRHVAEQLGFAVTGILTGDDVEHMDDAQLTEATETTNIFARITPAHKLRIINAFKAADHTVGYMGDGVNDAPALRAADVGISFEDAVDVAKEAADVILLQKKLSVLADGIREGRRTFVNTRTYVFATISSNFGNMLTITGAALLLPFIPLLPAQILLLNLLSDLPMLSLSADHVADADLAKPKKWDVGQISNFMYFFGSISSLADYATFALLIFVAHAGTALFRSGWFVESMLTEILIIFVFRSTILNFRDLPAWPLVTSSAAVVALTFALTQTALGDAFSFVPLTGRIIPWILLIVIGYATLTVMGRKLYEHYRTPGRSMTA